MGGRLVKCSPHVGAVGGLVAVGAFASDTADPEGANPCTQADGMENLVGTAAGMIGGAAAGGFLAGIAVGLAYEAGYAVGSAVGQATGLDTALGNGFADMMGW